MILPPRGPLRVHATLTFFDSLVPGIMLAGGVLFFTKVAGLGAVQVGSGLSAATLAGLAAALPAGRLGDRIGQRRLLIGLSLLRAVILGGYQLVGSYPAFLVVACLSGLAESGVAPVRQAYLATVTTPGNRVATLAFNRVVRNIGATLSTPALGLALALDGPYAFRALIGAGAVSVLAVALIATRLPETRAAAPRVVPGAAIPSAVLSATAPGAGPSAPEPAAAPGRKGVLHDPPYVALSLLNGLLIMHMELLEIGMPLWVTGHTGAPAWTTSVLLFTNVLVAIGLQIRVGRGVTDVGSAARALRKGGYCLLAASALFAASGTLGPAWSVAVLLGAVVLLTLTELLQSAGSWGLSYDLADPARPGEYQGVWSLGTQLVRACGPLAVTLALSSLAPLGWLLIGALYLAASTLPHLLTRRPSRPTPPPTPAPQPAHP
ncbi:MFS transporter [Streptomyces sp. 3211.6]|uniref:MFS transporter n=1 Tax=Streptomyces sp. 3211.6 TaxID=1938845 RepID=UPI000EB123CC|nr:MFS transporter [Streptomyces sp. 3211.6]